MLTCPFKQHFGYPCPGCGFQRSLIELFNGNLWTSIKYYPATIPLFLMALYLVCHLVFKYRNGARNLVILFVSNISIIYISFVLSLFNVWFFKK